MRYGRHSTFLLGSDPDNIKMLVASEYLSEYVEYPAKKVMLFITYQY